SLNEKRLCWTYQNLSSRAADAVVAPRNRTSKGVSSHRTPKRSLMFIPSHKWISELAEFRSRRLAPGRSRRCCAVPRLERLEDRTLLNAGDLDPTFGTGGKVLTDFVGPIEAVAAAEVIQPDGKILVAGTGTLGL